MRPSSANGIAIVGAGPAGLTAACVLQRQGRAVTVFEADLSTEARDQGGTLDLHPGSGQAALEMAGLLGAFRAVARYEDQETRLLHHATAEPLFEERPEPGEGDRPEIDRKALRDLLLASLQPGTVRWGRKLVRLLPGADGQTHRLRFADGDSGPFGLVIGADGAWSKVRGALVQARPAHTGITFVELWLDDVDRRHPAIARLVGHGTLFVLHGGKALFAQRNGGGHVRVYAAFRAPLDWPAGLGIEPADRARVRGEVRRLFAGWSPVLLALVDQAREEVFIRPIVALPPGLRWTPRPGVTVVGDAAHVMPPLGVGVNLAMLDAAELAGALGPGGDWTQAIARQEGFMLDRAAALAAGIHKAFAEMFAADAPRAVLDHMRARQGPVGRPTDDAKGRVR